MSSYDMVVYVGEVEGIPISGAGDRNKSLIDTVHSEVPSYRFRHTQALYKSPMKEVELDGIYGCYMLISYSFIEPKGVQRSVPIPIGVIVLLLFALPFL